MDVQSAKDTLHGVVQSKKRRFVFVCKGKQSKHDLTPVSKRVITFKSKRVRWVETNRDFQAWKPLLCTKPKFYHQETDAAAELPKNYHSHLSSFFALIKF